MNKTLIAFTVAMLGLSGAWHQKSIKPWEEWSKKDAQKILDDSPWSQSVTESNTSESSLGSTSMGDTRNRETQGTATQVSTVKFRVRFFSARPIRQAYVRLLELSQSEPSPEEATAKRRAWANLAASDSIIVTMMCESNDNRYLGRVMQSLNSADTSVLKNNVYLERKDGKRVFLSEYVPPTGKDLFGARFVFPRTLDGQPFVTPESGSLRFHVEYETQALESTMVQSGRTSSRSSGTSQSDRAYKFKLDMKFKVPEMTYNGELEY